MSARPAPLFVGLLFLDGHCPAFCLGTLNHQNPGQSHLEAGHGVFGWCCWSFSSSGVRNPGALLGFWLVSFTAFITLYDYGRAVLARAKRTGEGIFLAFWRLAGRNRRRYGGYTIHLGVVLMAIGIIGIELFQTETQGTLKAGQSINLAGYTVTYSNAG